MTPFRELGILHGVIAYQAISARLGQALERGNSEDVKKMRELSEQALTNLGVKTFLAYDFQAVESALDQLNYMKECTQKARKSKKKAA